MDETIDVADLKARIEELEKAQLIDPWRSDPEADAARNREYRRGSALSHAIRLVNQAVAHGTALPRSEDVVKYAEAFEKYLEDSE